MLICNGQLTKHQVVFLGKSHAGLPVGGTVTSQIKGSAHAIHVEWEEKSKNRLSLINDDRLERNFLRLTTLPLPGNPVS